MARPVACCRVAVWVWSCSLGVIRGSTPSILVAKAMGSAGREARGNKRAGSYKEARGLEHGARMLALAEALSGVLPQILVHIYGGGIHSHDGCGHHPPNALPVTMDGRKVDGDATVVHDVWDGEHVASQRREVRLECTLGSGLHDLMI